MDNNQLHQMNPQGRFSDRAEDYAKYRPSYPAEAIDCILEGLNAPSPLIAADVGAGTGISSRLLADMGVKVIAIEPNLAMRQVAKKHPAVEFRDGSAENTKLPSNSVDLVTCFQSFHWFNPEPTLTEFARILKPGGRLATVWNNRDRQDKFTQEYSNLIQIVSKNRSELRQGVERSLTDTPLFSRVTHLVFPYRQALDRDGLIGRTMSTSYVPKTGQVVEEFIKKLEELYAKYRDGKSLVYLKYNTSVYLTAIKCN